MSQIGHNSIAVNELEKFVERIERLDAERAEIAEAIKEVKAEAKAAGYSLKALNAVISLRKKDYETRAQIGYYAEAMRLFG